jgi:hypothetical protein
MKRLAQRLASIKIVSFHNIPVQGLLTSTPNFVDISRESSQPQHIYKFFKCCKLQQIRLRPNVKLTT